MDYWRENKCPEFKWYSWKHESWLAVTKGRKEDRGTRGKLCVHWQTIRHSREEVRRSRHTQTGWCSKRRRWALFWAKPGHWLAWTRTPFDQQPVLHAAVAAAKPKSPCGVCRVKGPVVHKSDCQPHLHVGQSARPGSPPSTMAEDIVWTQCCSLISKVAVYAHSLCFSDRRYTKKFSWSRCSLLEATITSTLIWSKSPLGVALWSISTLLGKQTQVSVLVNGIKGENYL